MVAAGAAVRVAGVYRSKIDPFNHRINGTGRVVDGNQFFQAWRKQQQLVGRVVFKDYLRVLFLHTSKYPF
jgi:hypothetical protein